MNASIDSSQPTLPLNQQVAIVTGGARGIGAAIVRRFVREGAHIVFSDILWDEGKALEAEIGASARFMRADSTDPSDIEKLVESTLNWFGKLDCLVNNAGAGGVSGPIAEVSIEGFDQTVALLLRGPFLGIKFASPHMKGGSIINIASISGLRGGYSPHIYCAAKFGVIGLTKTVSLELAERGIRVNAICPAGIPSAIFAGPQASTELARKTPAIVEPLLAEGVPLARAGSPDEIANAALFLASSQSAYITGQEIVVDGGLSVGVPWPIQIEIHQRYRERLQAA